jgi:hypothetical protein
VIQEVAVLLRVQHLQQRRGRVAVVAGADLVDLVEHDHRVGGAGVLHGLDELAGHGADVGAPVALDLGLVADAADREAVELAAQRVHDERPMLVLPTPGGPTSRMMEPAISPLWMPTARNSRMRSFTSSRP